MGRCVRDFCVSCVSSELHCKNYPYTPGYFVASVSSTGPRGFILFRRFMDTDVCGTAVPLKYRELARNYPRIYGYFYGVVEQLSVDSSTAAAAERLLLVALYRRASAAERPAEMPRRPTGQPRGDARRAARLLPATSRGRARVLAGHRQARQADHGQTQDRQTKVSLIAAHANLPPWLSGLAISGRGAVKAWLAIRQSVGSTAAPDETI